MLRKIISKKKSKHITYIDEANLHNVNLEEKNINNKDTVFIENISTLYEHAKSIVTQRAMIEENKLTIEHFNKKLNTFFNVNELKKNKKILYFFISTSLVVSLFASFSVASFFILKNEIEQQQGSYENYNLKLLNEHLKYQLITQEPVNYIQYLKAKHYENSKILTSQEKDEKSIQKIIKLETYKEDEKLFLGFLFSQYFLLIYLTFHFAVFSRFINNEKWKKSLSLERKNLSKNEHLLDFAMSNYKRDFSTLKPSKDTIYLQDEVLNFYKEQCQKTSNLSNSQFYILKSLTCKKIPPFSFDYYAENLVLNNQSNLIEDCENLKKELAKIDPIFKD